MTSVIFSAINLIEISFRLCNVCCFRGAPQTFHGCKRADRAPNRSTCLVESRIGRCRADGPLATNDCTRRAGIDRCAAVTWPSRSIRHPQPATIWIWRTHYTFVACCYRLNAGYYTRVIILFLYRGRTIGRGSVHTMNGGTSIISNQINYGTIFGGFRYPLIKITSQTITAAVASITKRSLGVLTRKLKYQITFTLLREKLSEFHEMIWLFFILFLKNCSLKLSIPFRPFGLRCSQRVYAF